MASRCDVKRFLLSDVTGELRAAGYDLSPRPRLSSSPRRTSQPQRHKSPTPKGSIHRRTQLTSPQNHEEPTHRSLHQGANHHRAPGENPALHHPPRHHSLLHARLPHLAKMRQLFTHQRGKPLHQCVNYAPTGTANPFTGALPPALLFRAGITVSSTLRRQQHQR